MKSVRVPLLNHTRLQNQLVSLERRTTRVGRDLVDHPPGGHDDCANAAAGALVLAAAAARREVVAFGIDMQGKITFKDNAKPRSWARTPGVSAATGEQYDTWKEAHRAIGEE